MYQQITSYGPPKYPVPADCPIPGAMGFQVVSGTGANRVLILGEAMGEAEAATGEGFNPYAQAGSVLARAFRRTGLRRESFLLYNVVPTRPPNNWLEGAPWEDEAIAWGRNYLEDVIKKHQPRVILALGAVALRTTSGMSGKKLGVADLSGFALPSLYGIPVVGYFHPSFLRRGGAQRTELGMKKQASGGGMALFGGLMTALKKAVALARQDDYTIEVPNVDDFPYYMLRPTEHEVEDFAYEVERCPEYEVMYDIETPESADEDSEEEEVSHSEIVSIQFSLSKDHGIYIPWREPFLQSIGRILGSRNDKYGWNIWKFDNPLVRRHFPIGGTTVDLMWAWHHLQPDLRRKLQFAAGQLGWPWPWKHLSGSEKEFYGIIDADILHFMKKRIYAGLQEKGIWRGFERHILMMNPVLEGMSRRGMPVDRARHKHVEEVLTDEHEHGLERLQAIVPDVVKPWHPKNGYKKPPKDTTGLFLRSFPDGDRLVRLDVWKPSHDGLIRYMRYKGHPVPTDYKTGKETTLEYEIKRMVKLDDFYQKVIDYREAGTILNNHVVNWRPGDDERVHSEFYFDPSTGQLSARRPNVHNAPKHKGHADLFRSMVVAAVGHVLLEFDYKSFHAQTLAFEAQDPDYLRLAKLNIHSYLAAHLVHEPNAGRCLGWDDQHLADYLEWIAKHHKFVRNYKAKRAILGYGFGMGWKKLYDMNKESFSSQSEAKHVIGMLDVLFPKCKKWRDQIRAQAHEQACLISRHGYIRYFWEVFKWSGGEWTFGGEDSESAIAFLPANDAFGEIKDRMLTLEEMGLLEKYRLINQIHDSLMFECPVAYADEALYTVPQIMSAPSTVLINPMLPGGLSVEVSASRGRVWVDKEDDNAELYPDGMEKVKIVRSPVREAS